MALIRFTQLSERLKYPKNLSAKLSSYHLEIINYVSQHYVNRVNFRRQVCQTLNTVSYKLVASEPLPDGWPGDNPLCIDLVDVDTLHYHLSKLGLYVDESTIEWDIIPTDANNHSAPKVSAPITFQELRAQVEATPKEDLYIQPPLVPRFDYTRPYMQQLINQERFAIYTSLPEVPTKQNEISVTTDIDKFTSSQLLNLFPHQFIRTRSPKMYEEQQGLEFDEQLGLIIPVAGFATAQVIQNIVEYPHLYQLRKVVDNDIVNFYSTIEIEGELVPIQSVWSDLPDTSKLPFDVEYAKEYVVRRYLLERDHGVRHKYPLWGSLDRYLTLFTTPQGYQEFGITIDPIDLARQCVAARVEYKRSRNPMIRRMNNG